MWWAILQLGSSNRSRLVLPIRIPWLLHYQPGEDSVQRIYREPALAGDAVLVDACKHGDDVGFYIPDIHSGHISRSIWSRLFDWLFGWALFPTSILT